jgi:hypothetical protein
MDILADYREWRDQQAARVSTHSDGCHMWHKDCMIHRLAAALAVEQAKRTPEPPSTPGEGTRQVEVIVTRLRQTRADMIGTDDEDHYWDCHEAAGEIERLRLTDAEREAIGRIAGYHDIHVSMDDRDTLRGLLERTNYPAKGDSSTGLR